MSTALRAKPITAEEYEKFDPEWRYELIRGELVPMPPFPGEEHGSVTSDLAFELTYYIKQHDLGQCYAAETHFLVERNPDTVIGPDWAFIRKERLGPKPGQKASLVVPDVVLEVRSPSDRKRQVEAKMQLWLSVGVRLAWELDLKTRILTVYRPGQPPREMGIDDTMTGEDVLPGFELPLRRIFNYERRA